MASGQGNHASSFRLDMHTHNMVAGPETPVTWVPAALSAAPGHQPPQSFQAVLLLHCLELRRRIQQVGNSSLTTPVVIAAHQKSVKPSARHLYLFPFPPLGKVSTFPKWKVLPQSSAHEETRPYGREIFLHLKCAWYYSPLGKLLSFFWMQRLQPTFHFSLRNVGFTRQLMSSPPALTALQLSIPPALISAFTEASTILRRALQQVGAVPHCRPAPK